MLTHFRDNRCGMYQALGQMNDYMQEMSTKLEMHQHIDFLQDTLGVQITLANGAKRND